MTTTERKRFMRLTTPAIWRNILKEVQKHYRVEQENTICWEAWDDEQQPPVKILQAVKVRPQIVSMSLHRDYWQDEVEVPVAR